MLVGGATGPPAPARGPDTYNDFSSSYDDALVEVAEGARPHRGADGGAALMD